MSTLTWDNDTEEPIENQKEQVITNWQYLVSGILMVIFFFMAGLWIWMHFFGS